MTNRFSKLIQEFLTDYIINECNYSSNTKTSYSTTFYLLLQFLNTEKNIKPDKVEIEFITKEIILQFLDWLETKRNVSISTRNQRLAGLKSFYKYVQINEPDLFNTCFQILTIKLKKVPKKIISHFTEDEIKIMIDYLNGTRNLKLLTMICVLYETGARVSEFINIKLNDLDLRDNANIILFGKGNKKRIVPISQYLVKLINKYLKEIYINYGNDYLFYSNQKKSYHRKSINYLINSIVKELHSKYPNYFKGHYFPHSFSYTNLFKIPTFNNNSLFYRKYLLF